MLRSAALALLLAFCGLLHAADPSRPMILVAAPQVDDKLFSETVLVAAPVGDDEHVGFILNLPTGVPLSRLFPDDAPSGKVVEPVYLGGPFSPDAIFALVQRSDSPGGESIELMPGLFAALDGATVDRVIRSEPAHARFVAGLMAWGPGELRDQIDEGDWYVLEPDAALALRKPTDGLWEELVRRSAQRENVI